MKSGTIIITIYSSTHNYTVNLDADLYYLVNSRANCRGVASIGLRGFEPPFNLYSKLGPATTLVLFLLLLGMPCVTSISS